MAISPKYLAGRCANGAERDCGTLNHAVDSETWKALCGAKPGRRSAGWRPELDNDPQYADLKVTCPRCLKKMSS